MKHIFSRYFEFSKISRYRSNPLTDCVSIRCVQSKKRKYEDADFHFDINDPLYGYTYKPRRSKRRRTKEGLSREEQIDAPYCHPLEILIAAALFVKEIEDKAVGSTATVTTADIKGVAANWDKILGESTLTVLKNVANEVDDISTTKQIL